MLGAFVTQQLIVDGFVNGLVYGMLALGIVLIFRSTRVINFAVGNMGLPGSVLFALLVLNWGFPFWIALVIALVVGTGLGLLIDLIVIRRLFRAPRVILLVATIGLAQLCLAIVIAYPPFDVGPGETFPRFWGSSWDDFAGLGFRFTGSQLAVVLIVPALAALLALFLNRTTIGQAVQASADNSDLARLSGINPRFISMMIWSIAGFVSTASMILLAQLSGAVSAGALQNLGPNTMVRGLAAAVIAGMRSFPRALAAGVLIGVGQAVVRFNFLSEAGLIDFLLFLAVLVAVFWQSRSADSEGSAFSFAPKVKPVPERIRSMFVVKYLNTFLFSALLVGAAVLPFLVTRPSRQLLYATIIGYAICAVSVTIITGWSGQLSLGQMAFAGLGALGATAMQRGVELDIGWGDTRILDVQFVGWPFVLSILVVPLFTAALAAIVGVSGLRVRGLMLAVSTFAFALAAQQYLYRRPVLSDGNRSSVPFERGDLFIWRDFANDRWVGFDLSTQRAYYYFALAVLVVVLIMVARLRRTGVGRSMIAVRDNPDSAAAYTVNASRTKLKSFALAGGVAGLGGAVLAGLLQSVNLTEGFFLNNESLRLVAIVVIGGLGSVSGPVLGALWVIGLPAFFPGNDLVPLLSSSIGLLVLLLYFPGGLVQIAYSLRDWFFGVLERRLPEETVSSTTAPPATLTRRDVDSAPVSDAPALEATNIEVSFGGNRAVDGASITIGNGEVVGLIGTNGAGKSTFMNAIGGYLPARGSVALFGEDVSKLSASARARRGFGRTFQSATLFPELTVRENVQVALEGRHRSPLVATALFLPHTFKAERRKATEASELIDFLGLGRYADTFIGDLSTGTRRIVELAGLLALDARILCLDEPTAGVAQRETEAFGPLMLEIRRELDASMLIIEHDMPLIMSLSDRVYCLESGAVIAEGDPEVVRNDPSVVASYLGTDERAIARSDA